MKFVKDKQITKKPMPSASDDEAFLRLGVPDGLRTDGSQPKCVYPRYVDDKEIPHNRKGKFRKISKEKY